MLCVGYINAILVKVCSYMIYTCIIEINSKAWQQVSKILKFRKLETFQSDCTLYILVNMYGVVLLRYDCLYKWDMLIILYESCYEKTKNVVSEQVRHKPVCPVTEDG